MLKAALKKYFGYESFRPGQEEIITAVLAGKPTFGLLPTGMGKSLCYQLPGYLLSGLVVVISPLLSLMEDQVLQLQLLGEKRVIAYNSLLSGEEKAYVLGHLTQYKFLFISPEMLQSEQVIQAFRHTQIAFFVVDEAHCVSQWGVDFRPEYGMLMEPLKKLGCPQVLALTATAPKIVQQEIREILFPNVEPSLFVSHTDRPNITLFVQETEDKLSALKELLSNLQGAGIVYCATRKEVEFLANELKNIVTTAYYHGGLTAVERRMLQSQYLNGQIEVLIATNAFGMGINKSDIRFVIHYDLPNSPENYLQEIGRAGRDGKPSQALLLYQAGDEQIHYFFQQSFREDRLSYAQLLNSGPIKSADSELLQKWLALHPNDEAFAQRLVQREEYKDYQLRLMLQYIHLTSCRRRFLLDYFQETPQLGSENLCCDNHGAVLQQKSREKVPARKTESWQEVLLRIFKNQA